MSRRSLPSIPLIRKPKFAGSPSTRDVKPEHKYLVRADRRLRAQKFAANVFKLEVTKERAEERVCREKIQEDVVDYRGSGQSPKRKVAESTTIRRLTSSLCSLPRRSQSTKIFVRFNKATDVDMDEEEDEDNSMDLDDTPLNLDADPDFEMDDSSFDMDVDTETKATPTPVSFTHIFGLVYPPFTPPPHPGMDELVQLMSALCVSPPPPPYVPTPAPAMPAPAPPFPPGLQVPAAEASKAAMAAEAAPLGAAPVANGAASKGKAARVSVPWNVLFQFMSSQAAEQGPSRASTSTSAPATAEPLGEDVGAKSTTKSGRLRRMRERVVNGYKTARKNKDKGL